MGENSLGMPPLRGTIDPISLQPNDFKMLTIYKKKKNALKMISHSRNTKYGLYKVHGGSKGPYSYSRGFLRTRTLRDTTLGPCYFQRAEQHVALELGPEK